MTRLALLLVLAAGCGKVVGDLPLDTDGGPPRDGALPSTIRDIKLSMPRPGDSITLRNVVVLATSVVRDAGIVWVQDQGGGMGSGLRLVCSFDAGCPTTRARIEDLGYGDRLDVSGVWDVTAAPAEPQLLRFSMTDRGSATPAATSVDAALVAHDQAGATATTPYVAAYVTVSGPFTVTDVAPNALRESCEAVDAGPAPAYRGVFVRHNGSGRVLAIQTIELDYCVSQCGFTCASEIMVGDAIPSLTGVVIIGERAGSSAELIIRPARNQDFHP